MTKDRFIPHPFSLNSQARLYKSGDLARYLPSGEIEYLGRMDDQVKVSGFRIELGEIDTALLAYPEIAEAVTIVREDPPGKKVLVSYFTSTTDRVVSKIITDLRQFLKQRLPDFMVPTSLMALVTMPLTPTGKIDRQALPQPDFAADRELYVAPRTLIEQQIFEIWAQLLKLDSPQETLRERVGIHDNFFELGGYSLVGIQMIARLRQVLQVEILMSNLFEFPTVLELAERIENLRWVAQGIEAAGSDLTDDYEEGEL